jgi:hypothetical protein
MWPPRSDSNRRSSARQADALGLTILLGDGARYQIRTGDPHHGKVVCKPLHQSCNAPTELRQPGAPNKDRTYDLSLRRAALYPLSYRRKMCAGGSPATWLQGMDSNHRFPGYEPGEIGHFSTLRRWCAQPDSNRQVSRFAAWCSIQLSHERTMANELSDSLIRLCRSHILVPVLPGAGPGLRPPASGGDHVLMA